MTFWLVRLHTKHLPLKHFTAQIEHDHEEYREEPELGRVVREHCSGEDTCQQRDDNRKEREPVLKAEHRREKRQKEYEDDPEKDCQALCCHEDCEEQDEHKEPYPEERPLGVFHVHRQLKEVYA